MPTLSTDLKPAARGGYAARKTIPADVRDAYGTRYCGGRAQWEARFKCGPMSATAARAQHREWLSLIESRIANIRAERMGKGQILTPQTARALAAEWYRWFVAKSDANGWTRDQWRAYREWLGLPAAERATKTQATAFALQATQRHQWRASGDPYQEAIGWISNYIGKP
jgi:hypothetical protein